MRLACLVFTVFAFLLLARPVWAQNISSVAVNVEVVSGEASENEILSATLDGFARSAESYDSSMFGVVSNSSVISTGERTDTSRGVVTSGPVRVKVSGDAIAIGDYVTSSDTAGIGKKAMNSGIVLGRALEVFDGGDAGLITINVNIGFAEIGITPSTVAKAIAQVFGNPSNFQAFSRNAFAFGAGVLVFFGAVYAFVKFVSSGITSLGRNPMAKGTIMGGMLVSSLVVVVLATSGFGIALAIMNFKWPFN